MHTDSHRAFDIQIKPRDWQIEALRTWRTSMRGVIAAVTGAGKTTFALMCVQKFLSVHPQGRVVILVPTLALMDQWYLSLVEDLEVKINEIGVIAGGRRDWEGKRFVVAVINSMRKFSVASTLPNATMLIVDECHRAGSEQNSLALLGNFVATLGLSATPNRQYDDGFERHIRPVLGDVIFNYGYDKALADGVIVPFQLLNVRFSLTSGEQKDYNALTKRIAVTMKSDRPHHEKYLESLLRRRARISWNSPLRVPLAVKLALKYHGERVIVFHESIAQATEINRLLSERGIRSTIYHSGLLPEKRRENLHLYRNGYYSCLVCCRALDEGLNVPNTSIGIVACGTSSIRQRIQRLGRVLRQVPGKPDALICTVYATDAERKRLQEESTRMSDITRVKWLDTKVQRNG